MLDDESFEKKFEAVGCRCWMTQLLTAASVIKSSAVQNLHTDGPSTPLRPLVAPSRWSDLLLLRKLVLTSKSVSEI